MNWEQRIERLAARARAEDPPQLELADQDKNADGRDQAV